MCPVGDTSCHAVLALAAEGSHALLAAITEAAGRLQPLVDRANMLKNATSEQGEFKGGQGQHSRTAAQGYCVHVVSISYLHSEHVNIRNDLK